MLQRNGLASKRRLAWMAIRLIAWMVTVPVLSAATAGDLDATPDDHDLERRLQRVLGDQFTFVRSDHFVLAHDVDDAAAGTYLVWLEGAFDDVTRFLEAHELSLQPVRLPLVVVCTADFSAFKRRAQAHRPDSPIRSGYYDRSTGRSYFGHLGQSDHNEDKAEAIQAAMRLTVRHETFHQVTDAVCPRLNANMPEWLSEGLACVFEIAGTDDGEGLPPANKWRATDFLARFGDTGDAASNRRRQLEAIELVRGPDLSANGTRLTEPQRYAAAWAIAHYLATERPGAFKKYLRRLAEFADVPGTEGQSELFEEAFGPADARLAEEVFQSANRAIQAKSR